MNIWSRKKPIPLWHNLGGCTYWDYFKSETALRAEAVKTIAAECGQIFLPLQQMFDDACTLAPAEYWIGDGVHPTVAGHKLIADAWMR
ncbi:MAG: hypothetical protein IKZ36_05925, partial [Kiritimatiellae bacterium]|nr:hypothetical protein [Kiritimatiellia bacterium]